jgi:hypothetical protein
MTLCKDVGAGYTDFAVAVAHDGREWSVNKRYSEFLQVYTKSGLQIDFPSKQSLNFGFGLSDSQLEKRRDGLHAFIRLLVKEKEGLAGDFLEDKHARKTDSKGPSASVQANQIPWALVQAIKRLKVPRQSFALSLEAQGIKSDGAAQLVEALAGNRTCSSLNLDGNKVGAKGAGMIASLLKSGGTDSCAVSAVFLSKNELGTIGAMPIADALMGNNFLCQLELSGNAIGNEGLSALGDALKRNCRLQHLDLSCNPLGGTSPLAVESIGQFGEALKVNLSLDTLLLADACLGAVGIGVIADSLKSNAALTSIDLSNNTSSSPSSSGGGGVGGGGGGGSGGQSHGTELLNGAGSGADAPCSAELELEVRKQQLTAFYLTHEPSKVPEVHNLLTSYRYDDVVASLMKKYGKVPEEWSASGADELPPAEDGAIACCVADMLKANHKLRVITLRHNKIGPLGAMSIAQALLCNCTVERLELGWNCLGDDGLAIFAAGGW